MYLLERCSMGFMDWGVGAVGGTNFPALGLQALLCWGEGGGRTDIQNPTPHHRLSQLLSCRAVRNAKCSKHSLPERSGAGLLWPGSA